MTEYLANLKRLSNNDKCADCGKPGKLLLVFGCGQKKMVSQLCPWVSFRFCQPGSERAIVFDLHVALCLYIPVSGGMTFEI